MMKIVLEFVYFADCFAKHDNNNKFYKKGCVEPAIN